MANVGDDPAFLTKPVSVSFLVAVLFAVSGFCTCIFLCFFASFLGEDVNFVAQGVVQLGCVFRDLGVILFRVLFCAQFS